MIERATLFPASHFFALFFALVVWFAPAHATSATGGPATEGPVAGGPATEGPATEGPATEGPAAGGPVAGGPAAGGPVAGGPAAGGPATEGPVADPVLRIGIRQYPPILHPLYDSMMAKSFVLGAIQRPIMAWDTDWQPICLLCLEIPSFENGKARIIPGPDGKDHVELTWRLDPRARWGDGTPVTTSDILLAWEIGRNRLTGVVGGDSWRRIKRMEARGDHEWVMEIDRVNYDYNLLGGFYLLPSHIERVHAADPKQYRERSAYHSDPFNPGLWLGPYRLAEQEVGEKIMLVRNEHWMGPSPYWGGILITATENSTVLETRMQTGEIDMIPASAGLAPDRAHAFERRQGERFKVKWRSGLFYEHIDIRLDNPILANPLVRRALLAGLGRETMVRTIFGGRVTVAHGPLAPDDPMYPDRDTDGLATVHDPERARSLLEQAGWQLRDGGDDDGIRRNHRGERLRLELVTTSDSRTRALAAQLIQSQWRTIGVELVLKFESPRVLFGETVGKRKFRHLAMYAWISAPDSTPRSTLRSDQIPGAENLWVGQNIPGLRDGQMDKILDKLEASLQPARRRAQWRRLLRRYADLLPALPLYFSSFAHILPRENLDPPLTGHLSPSTLWIESWWR